jgi:hypothetical protein
MRKSCGICGAPNQLGALDKSGQYAELKVSVQGMPAAKCTHGHHAPVEQEFMLWLIHELKEKEGTIPAGRQSGMLFLKKYTCACGAELPGHSDRRQAFSFDMAHEGYPAFKAEVEAPVYKCSGCGKEQVHSPEAVRGHTSQAIMKLHDACGFPHAG